MNIWTTFFPSSKTWMWGFLFWSKRGKEMTTWLLWYGVIWWKALQVLHRSVLVQKLKHKWGLKDDLPSCGPWLIISKSILKCTYVNSRFLSCHFCECKTEAVTAHMMMNPGQYRLSIWPSNVGGFLSRWCSPSYSCFPFDRNPLFT